MRFVAVAQRLVAVYERDHITARSSVVEDRIGEIFPALRHLGDRRGEIAIMIIIAIMIMIE
jgi:hypothetical protein